jgi:uncharacterized membrane protein
MRVSSLFPPPSQGSRLDGVDVLRGLAILFVLLNHVNIILIAAVLGELVARLYSEPMNQRLRERWRDRTQRALDTQPD